MKSTQPLKTGILVFWTLWFTCAFITNFFDLFNQYSMMPTDWKFLSHNYALVKGVLSIYHLPEAITTLLFILILITEGIIMCLFWMAVSNKKWINSAFTVSLFLWAGFLVGEEIFIAYAFEGVHLNLLVAELVSLLAIRLLP